MVLLSGETKQHFDGEIDQALLQFQPKCFLHGPPGSSRRLSWIVLALRSASPSHTWDCDRVIRQEMTTDSIHHFRSTTRRRDQRWPSLRECLPRAMPQSHWPRHNGSARTFCDRRSETGWNRQGLPTSRNLLRPECRCSEIVSLR